MDHAAPLYQVVCQELVTDIYSGKLKNGDRLPTLQQLGSEYNAGRNTVRSALQLLYERGYLTQVNQKQMTICFDFENPETRQRYLEDLACRKAAISDVFDTLALLMPELAVYCLRTGSAEQLKKTAALCEHAVEGNVASERDLFFRLFEVYQYAIAIPGNQMLDSLLDSMFHFIMVPLSSIERTSPAFRLSLVLIRLVMKKFRNIVLSDKADLLKDQLEAFCRSSRRRSDHYLDRICKGVPTNPSVPFLWFPEYPAGCLYAELIYDILTRILTGEYQTGDPLPSYAELASLYHVSEKTSRKAVAILNRAGLVQTSNGKRTRIAAFPIADEAAFLRDPFIQIKLKSSCEAMEILTILCPPVIRESSSRIPPGRLAAYADEIASMKNRTPDVLIEPFYRGIPSDCVQTVFRQLKKAASWGHLIELVSAENTALFEKVRSTLPDLLREGDTDRIIAGYCSVFQEILNYLKTYTKDSRLS